MKFMIFNRELIVKKYYSAIANLSERK